eukprot:CAMPEP_0115057828 /NCGR_PEP_ID=MMETSP0227-20121206/5986_1 /TAXON_ID=89957 /ORGANISM="Polarella glacialis, Strain CCMP 1383" /LENGTH=643 /DNA_ID=CAMNT_0002442697 /DNA_START=64 /DNA_END=1996 /DNA_ORIENTATION=+
MTSAERNPALNAGLTLHRSETVAHTVALMENKSGAAAARAKGRCEGFASKASLPFRPLGAPIKVERIAEINTTKLAKVQKVLLAVGRDAVTHNDADKKKRRDNDPGADWQNDAKDEDQGPNETQDLGLEVEKKEIDLDSLPHGLYGKDLPRVGRARRKQTDGFLVLKSFVKISDHRLDQVRTDVYDPAIMGQSAVVSNTDRSLGAGAANRPQSRGSAFSMEETAKFDPSQRRISGGSNQPLALSARGPRSAAVFLTAVPTPSQALLPSSGVERSERGDALRNREMINTLLGLPKGTVLRGQGHDEVGGVRRGRMHIRRKLEKDLDSAWKDKAFWKRCNNPVNAKDAEELRARCHGNDEQLAALERILRDLSTQEEANRAPEPAVTAGGAAEAAGPGGMVGTGGGPTPDRERTAAEGSASPTKRGQRTDVEEDDPNAKANEEGTFRQRVVTRKALAQLEPADPQTSPIARLRKELYTYQASRDDRRDKLKDSLKASDSQRGDALKKRSGLGSTGGADNEGEEAGNTANAQHHWYRDLLFQVRGQLDKKDVPRQFDKKDVPKVINLILDAVRESLEQGQEFDSDAYFALLEQVGSDDVNPAVAALLVAMLKGIRGLQPHDLVGWFEQHRGELPPEVAEALGDDRP